MLDQAEALRVLVRDRFSGSEGCVSGGRVYTIAITSGKGGVGKTNLAVNLALLLGRSGRSVRLVDADFGLSNAEVLVGVTPKYTVGDVLQGEIEARNAWTVLPGGVKLLSSGSGLESVANMDGASGAALLDHVRSSSCEGDIVIVDTSPGIGDSVVSLLERADEVMVVTTPEPTSMTDSYAAIKVLLSRAPDTDVSLVVNNCVTPACAAGVARSLDGVCLRFLGRSFSRYDYIPADSAMARAVRTRTPVAVAQTDSAALPWFRKMAIRVAERAERAFECSEVAVR